jgi:hypothetical protein
MNGHNRFAVPHQRINAPFVKLQRLLCPFCICISKLKTGEIAMVPDRYMLPCVRAEMFFEEVGALMVRSIFYSKTMLYKPFEFFRKRMPMS